MAASIYATPPPDLSSEDTALSDVSNSSINHNNNNNNNNNNNRNRRNSSNTQSPDSSEATSAAKKSKRFIADVLMDAPSQQQHQLSPQQQQQYQEQTTSADMGSSTNTAKATTASTDADTTTQSANAAIAAVAAAANAAMQLQLLEAINDAAKKRRKQNNPIRLGGLNLTGDAAVAAENVGAIETTLEIGTAAETGSGTAEVTSTELLLEGTSENEGTIDYEEKLSKMFLPKSMEQLKETFEMLQQQQQQQQQQREQQQQKQLNDISTATLASTKEESNEHVAEHNVATSNDLQSNVAEAKNAQTPQLETDGMENPYQTYCKECGENFETEFKLSLHMLAEHAADDAASQHDAPSNREQLTPYDILASVKVKMEHPDYDSQSPQQAASSINEAQPMLSNGKEQQQWLSQMPGSMSFPHFPPEAAAAAALSAGGYLPLLGGLPGFPGVDGLNRPPLRIFNPEAYCDLCNKEFCNKYFLKTHKANKHGIYDPANSGSTESAGSNSMSQMFQLQMQQQHQLAQQQQQLQQQQQKSLDQQQQMQAAVEAQAKQQQQQQQQHFLQQATQAQLNIPQQQQQQQQQQPQITPPAPPPIFCEICSKRFTNVFAMRRHRAKTHEQRTSPNEQPSKSETTVTATQKPESPKTTDTATKNFQMPEGFRQDFTLEQEEVSFTPQPRKLSPQSQQLARDANFSHDKLKRLGVLNPEAFCELCCKEYCNKYFLRTHKWKRHGIFVPPEEVKEELLAPPKMQSTAWPFMNMPAMPSGMPLNLMMANQESRVLAARGMLAAAAATKQLDADVTQQMAKRIKLESTEEDESLAHDSLENQENKSENQRAEESRRQQPQITSSSTSPEPQKMLQDSITNAFNLPVGSPDAAVGLQNLQKLQSMIQQLNDLNGKRPVGCHLCGKEMENQYSLHAHLMTEHAAPPGMPADTKAAAFSFQQHLLQQQHALKLSPTSSPHGSMLPNPADLRCIQCDREFATTQEFKQHIAEVHLLPGSPLRDGFVTPERPINAQTGTGARAPYTMTPTSSYCEICNKELCNKYFMKTHMQRMHGIEIENGAQIGGVVCNICNKELCSKYFLRVHKHNTHGIIEEGSPLPQPRQNGLGFEAQQQQQQQQQQHQQQQQQQLMESELARGMTLSPFSSSDAPKPDATDARYMQQHYNEACPLCNRRFRSPKWLRAHLMSDHGSAGAEKLRELDLQYGNISKPSSPTLKIPNGTAAGVNMTGTNPVNLAQALQSLNSQHLLGNMPKAAFPGMFGTVAEQALQSPRFKEYQCSMCAFTTPYYAFLFIHERSHSILNTTASGSGSPSAEQHQQQQLTASNDENLAPTTIPTKPDAIKIEQTSTSPKSEQQAKNLPRETNVESTSFEATDLSKRSVSTPATPTEAPTTASNGFNESQARSAANSPFVTTPVSFNVLPTQDIIKQLAQNCGKPACYAVPHQQQQQQQQTSEGATPQEMQAFIMEEHHTTAQINDAGNAEAGDGERSANRFVPAIIYLPVRERISGPLTVSFTLTPA